MRVAIEQTLRTIPFLIARVIMLDEIAQPSPETRVGSKNAKEKPQKWKEHFILFFK
jgi:hypothetical protein